MLLQRLLDNLGLEVEPFATCGVAPGWRLRLPAGDLVTLHFVLEGEGGLVGEGPQTTPLPTHSLAVVPPGVPHQLVVGEGALAEERTSPHGPPGLTHLRAGPDAEVSLVVACGRIRATWGGVRGLFDTLHEPLVVEFADTPQMPAVFDALLAEQRSATAGREQMAKALMWQCLVEFFRRFCVRGDCSLPWLAALDDQRLARALQAILHAPEQDHSLGSLAREAAMSRSAFAARFRAAFDRAPMEYLREVRLREAARMLRQSSLPVDTVAGRAGFASRSHFSRTFRELFGQSPSAYRASA
jgi:AraC family transcriptional activator of mtrCDE